MASAADDDRCLVTHEEILDPLTRAALVGVTRAFASIGRAFVCLDAQFRIVHAAQMLDRFLGEGPTAYLHGRMITEILGDDLFGPDGPLREALLAGQRREGWRGTLQFEGRAPHLVSVTVAPLEPESADVCDPRITYIVVLRPSCEEEIDSNAPTFFSGAIASSAPMLKVFRLVDFLRNLGYGDATADVPASTASGFSRGLASCFRGDWAACARRQFALGAGSCRIEAWQL